MYLFYHWYHYFYRQIELNTDEANPPDQQLSCHIQSVAYAIGEKVTLDFTCCRYQVSLNIYRQPIFSNASMRSDGVV